MVKRDDFHSKLLFFVKNKGQWNAKSGPKVADGIVAMRIFFRDVWSRNESGGQKLVKFCTLTHAASRDWQVHVRACGCARVRLDSP